MARSSTAAFEVVSSFLTAVVVVQNLSPQELAAVVCSMIAAELPTRTTISVQYGCSSTVLEAIEAMEGDRERLYYLQMDAGISASLVVDLRLAGELLMGCTGTPPMFGFSSAFLAGEGSSVSCP